jgi:CheY-like chemotaxis protein
MPKKILICDDDLQIIKTVSERLKANGYDVISANDGIQSVSAAHKQNPDLILLDINMPAGNGETVYQNLKKSYHTNSIHVILFSALPYLELEQRAERLGVTDFITKPYDSNELLLKIQKALGEK